MSVRWPGRQWCCGGIADNFRATQIRQAIAIDGLGG